jgi:hypothetical protein
LLSIVNVSASDEIFSEEPVRRIDVIQNNGQKGDRQEQHPRVSVERKTAVTNFRITVKSTLI